VTYPTLLSPLRVRGVTLPNRVIMGSMHTGYEEQGTAGTQALAEFYAARARGGVGLLVTGGYAPNAAGRMKSGPGYLSDRAQLDLHRPVPQAVHQAGGRILLQILHAGRYGMHGDIVAPSAVRAPISRTTPHALSDEEIRHTIGDYRRCAALAVEAGYDGVEIMASEGYLICQFLALRTNQRQDHWGGSFINRLRFAVDVVRAARDGLGPDKLLLYRLSVLDLVEGGLSLDEVVEVARAIAAAGADILTTGVGWHEASVPTVANIVTPGLFSSAVRQVRQAVGIPVAASNRITTPEIAERILAEGDADLVALARPLLADENFVAKAAAGQGDRVTPCIACNQACLDHYFTGAIVSCLVNPATGRETEFAASPAAQRRRIAVVGGGVAGLAAAITAARRGHDVTLFEARPQLGGQFRLAAAVPGKADYARVVDAYERQLRDAGGTILCNHRVDAAGLAGFEAVILASGITPRRPDLPGIDLPLVVGYEDVLAGRVTVGDRVAIIGAGGIGFDLAVTLLEPPHLEGLDAYVARWQTSGTAPRPRRQITILKRSPGPFGQNLGKTTGWILRRELAEAGVTQLAGIDYRAITPTGLTFSQDGVERHLTVDSIVLCAGQTSNQSLLAALTAAGMPVEVIGGAAEAGELDAKRAIEEGVRAGLKL